MLFRSIYDSIPLQEVEEVLQDMKEDEVDFSIREYVDRVLAGEGELSLAGMESYVRNYIVHQFEANRKTFLRLILFGILSGVFLNFSSTMYEKQMGETGFQIIYFLVVTIMVTGFFSVTQVAGDVLADIIQFMNALIPSFPWRSPGVPAAPPPWHFIRLHFLPSVWQKMY